METTSSCNITINTGVHSLQQFTTAICSHYTELHDEINWINLTLPFSLSTMSVSHCLPILLRTIASRLNQPPARSLTVISLHFEILRSTIPSKKLTNDAHVNEFLFDCELIWGVTVTLAVLEFCFQESHTYRQCCCIPYFLFLRSYKPASVFV